MKYNGVAEIETALQVFCRLYTTIPPGYHPDATHVLPAIERNGEGGRRVRGRKRKCGELIECDAHT